MEGDQVALPKVTSVTAMGSSHNEHVQVKEGKGQLSIQGSSVGKDEVVFELAGLPIKKVDVNVLKDFKVIPGGQSIGVKLNTVGVFVVGLIWLKQIQERCHQEKKQEFK